MLNYKKNGEKISYYWLNDFQFRKEVSDYDSKFEHQIYSLPSFPDMQFKGYDLMAFKYGLKADTAWSSARNIYFCQIGMVVGLSGAIHNLQKAAHNIRKLINSPMSLENWKNNILPNRYLNSITDIELLYYVQGLQGIFVSYDKISQKERLLNLGGLDVYLNQVNL